jgi:UDP-N-acetyl-D-mannosaminuronic acid transferase (WecB/TagA/CpsF family)
MKGNKNYKDTVFRSIFNNEPIALELYNALNGTNYTDASIIKINTLKDVLFKTLENDLSFEINNKMLMLIEHQSTINENMTVRFLAYIAGIYLKRLGKKLYQGPLEKLPKPEFIVLYNGEAPFSKGKNIPII